MTFGTIPTYSDTLTTLSHNAIFRDEVRKNLEEFCKLSDKLVSERKFLIRYLGEQKKILVNNIKSNILE